LRSNNDGLTLADEILRFTARTEVGGQPLQRRVVLTGCRERWGGDSGRRVRRIWGRQRGAVGPNRGFIEEETSDHALATTLLKRHGYARGGVLHWIIGQLPHGEVPSA